MKRPVIALCILALIVVAACSSVTAPGTKGTITAVNDNTITVAASGASTMTYTLNRNTNVYSSDGLQVQRSVLSPGHHVQVWAKGDTAIRINIES